MSAVATQILKNGSSYYIAALNFTDPGAKTLKRKIFHMA